MSRCSTRRCSFLEGRELQPGEHDAYFLPDIAEQRASLYEHCARALDQSLAVGEHGLPLMGTGDWNDGMNRVGEGGKGRACGWLGSYTRRSWKWIPIASTRADSARSASWLTHAAALKTALEAQAWDGEWYRRGYFDDGTPLGSAGSVECRIDCIAQSWGVISARLTRRAPRKRWPRSNSSSFLSRQNSRSSLHRPSIRRRSSRAISRLSAGNPRERRSSTPTLPPGRSSPSQAWVRATAPNNSSRWLNPINHARTRAQVHRYKVEPYVVAADIYSVPPHAGTRWLDLVYGLRGMALPRGRGGHPGTAGSRHDAHPCAVHPPTLARLRTCI